MLAAIGRTLRLKYSKLMRRGAAAAKLDPGKSVVAPGVRSSMDAGGAVLLHVGRGLVFKSNSTGARIWQGLLDRRSPNYIAEELSREYGVPRDLTRNDVDAFMSALLAHGLLTRSRA